MDGGREVMEPAVRLSPLCGLLSMSRPLMLGWSICKEKKSKSLTSFVIKLEAM